MRILVWWGAGIFKPTTKLHQPKVGLGWAVRIVSSPSPFRNIHRVFIFSSYICHIDIDCEIIPFFLFSNFGITSNLIGIDIQFINVWCIFWDSLCMIFHRLKFCKYTPYKTFVPWVRSLNLATTADNQVYPTYLSIKNIIVDKNLRLKGSWLCI